MPSRERAPFVSLTALLTLRHPGLDDPAALIASCRVLDGRAISNTDALVRSGSSIKLLQRAEPLGDTLKLAHASRELSLELIAAVAVDIGAATGGFTHALLDAGGARVYAVDTSFGQLRGHMRRTPGAASCFRRIAHCTSFFTSWRAGFSGPHSVGNSSSVPKPHSR